MLLDQLGKQLGKFFAVLFILLSIALPAMGQSFKGRVVGTIKDSTGAVIGGASVSVTNIATGEAREVTTDEAGNFILVEVTAGKYKVQCDVEGFQSIAGQLSVGVMQDLKLSLTLLPAVAKQDIVEIKAGDVPLVDKSSTNTGGILTDADLANLPVAGDDFSRLIVLSPGTVADPSGSSGVEFSTGLFNANGNRDRSNNYLIDGFDANEPLYGLPVLNATNILGQPASVLPSGTIQEFAISSNYGAEYGRNTGAVVNIVTQSGGNQAHGQANYTFGNDKLNARNFFNQFRDKGAFKNNQYSFNFSAPIKKDQTFIFAGFEGIRLRATESLRSTTLNPGRTTILENVLLSLGLQLSDLTARLKSFYPAPTRNDVFFNNYEVQSHTQTDTEAFVVKVDHKLNAKNNLSLRYIFSDSRQIAPVISLNGSPLDEYRTNTKARAQSLGLGLVTTLSANSINEVRVAYNRFSDRYVTVDQLNQFDPKSIGLVIGPDPSIKGLPSITLSGYIPLGGQTSLPRDHTSNSYQFVDNLSLVHGNHAFKFGGEFSHEGINLNNDTLKRGQIRFVGCVLNQLGSIEPLLDFLIGESDNSIVTRGNTNRITTTNNFGFFAQDSWKVNKRLTINYGVRYDVFGVLHEKRDRFGVFDPVKVLVPVGTPGHENLYDRDLNNFAPRLGLAYDLTGDGKTVMRASFGVYNDKFSSDVFLVQSLGLLAGTGSSGPGYNAIGQDPVFALDSRVLTVKSNQQIVGGSAGFNFIDVFTNNPHLRSPYVYNGTLNISRQLTPNMVLQVGYVTSLGHKLLRVRNINENPVLTRKFPSVASQLPVFLNRPFNNVSLGIIPASMNQPGISDIGSINFLDSIAKSNYHSLQIQFTRRMSKGLTVNVGYNFSHSLDDASDGINFTTGVALPQSSFDLKSEYARSNFDTRHRLYAIVGYDLPGKGQLLGGWSTQTVLQTQSGRPWSSTIDWDPAGSASFTNRGNRIADPQKGFKKSVDGFANLKAYDQNNLASFGSDPRNGLQGPNYFQMDLYLTKTFKLSERVKFAFRTEFINVLNHPNFALPDPFNPAFGNTSFGTINKTPDVGAGNPFLGGAGPRVIQFGLKLDF